MHEVALSRQIARIVERAAAGRRVTRVEVEVGQLRQVVPEALRYAWTFVVAGTPLASAGLVVTAVPATVRCAACGAEATLDAEVRFDCGACGAPGATLVRGEEFRVCTIDVDGPGTPASGEG
nr:hydrogenase maturation nickel metallochaperone HypA [Propionibacterium sp.]